MTGLYERTEPDGHASHLRPGTGHEFYSARSEAYSSENGAWLVSAACELGPDDCPLGRHCPMHSWRDAATEAEIESVIDGWVADLAIG